MTGEHMTTEPAAQVYDQAQEQTPFWTKRRVQLAGALLGAGAILTTGGIVACSDNGGESAPAGADGGEASDADWQAIRDALTISSTNPDIDCAVIVEKAGGQVRTTPDNKKVITPQIGALLPVDPSNPTMRRWGDNLDSPYLADKANKEALLAETQLAICEDPLFGETVANMFANMQVGDVKVVDLNPWLQEAAGAPEDINDKAAKFVPLLDTGGQSVTEEQVKQSAEVNLQYQQLANLLNTMLTRFQNNGNQDAGWTTFNYHLDADGMDVGGLPEVTLNPEQYIANGDASALVLELTKKPGICVLKIGFNITDKRPEGFECAVPEEVPAPEQPADTTPPSHDKPGTTIPRRDTTTSTYPEKQPERSYNRNTGPNNGPGADGEPGTEGTTSIAPTTTQASPGTTIRLGGDTTTSVPAGPCGEACE